jgi:beta-glucosidase
MRQVAVLVGLWSALAAFAGCSSDEAAAPSGPPEEVTFPANFLFGSATAAFQIETGNLHTDWGTWVSLDGRIKNGDKPDVGGPDALHHVDEDVGALRDTGQNAYRLSIEWGRIYPTRAAFDADTPDADALAAYDGILGKLRAAGITPMVTLQHFALPDYLSDPTKSSEPQGWERPETTELFAQFAARMAARFKDKVDWWVTINEPLVVAVTGYVAGLAPPGAVLQAERAFAVVRAEARAHARAFDAIHQADTVDADGDGKSALVSVAAHQRTFHALDPAEPEDVTAAERVRYLWNLWFLNAIVRGDWDEDMDGVAETKADPALVHRADYLGINYYSDTLVSAGTPPRIPIVNASVRQDHLDTPRPKTDIAWDIYPEGLRTVLLEAKDYGLPVVITENGLADSTDRNRVRYLAEHLYQAGWARAEGVDLRGYFHWSLMDNFEWSSGYCPKFGLFSVDPQSGARTARPSADAYKGFIARKKVTRAEVDAAPPYGAPAECP